MRFKNFIFILIIISAAFLSCGAPGNDEIIVSGDVVIPGELSAEVKGPLFIGVSRTDDVELMKSDPLNQIVTIVSAKGLSFEIDLTESELGAGEEIFMFAFADNDYNGGIPNPTPGDIIGFYINSDTLSTKFSLKSGESYLAIDAVRSTYDISASVIGIIDGSESGNVILIAYAGDFNSLDFTALDTDAIIGYKRIKKGESPCSFELKIFPYITPDKYSLPLLGVYIIALLDKNSSGVPDSGDVIGFPVSGTDGDYPLAMNIQNGVNSCGTLYFRKTVSEPADPENPIKLSGKFDAPAEYDGTPMFLVVAKSSDPDEVFADMIDTVKYFKNVSANYDSIEGTFSFDEDLSSSGLLAGDTVMIIALWDRDFDGGFPEATAGDMAGFLQNREQFAFTVQLNSGTNNITRENDGSYTFGTAAGYDFSIKRTIYSHSASIKFSLEQGSLSDTEFANGNLVQVIALYDETGSSVTNKSIEMDSIIASSKVLIEHDADAAVTSKYTMNIFPAIPSYISGIDPDDLSIPDVYIVGFLDSNGNGVPDTGEKVAFYYRWLFVYLPDSITVEDGINVPDKNIRFSQTF